MVPSNPLANRGYPYGNFPQTDGDDYNSDFDDSDFFVDTSYDMSRHQQAYSPPAATAASPRYVDPFERAYNTTTNNSTHSQSKSNYTNNSYATNSYSSTTGGRASYNPPPTSLFSTGYTSPSPSPAKTSINYSNNHLSPYSSNSRPRRNLSFEEQQQVNRLHRFHQKYLPTTHGYDIRVAEDVLDEFRGKEVKLFKTLCRRFGPEPPDNYQGESYNSTYFGRLQRFHDRYVPNKSQSDTEHVLKIFAGREEELFRKLVARFGPEPSSQVMDI